MGVISRIASITILVVIYRIAALFSRLAKRSIKGWNKKTGKILVIATFHNPNWFRAHIKPLTKCGFDEVLLICDKAEEEMDGVRYFCPPNLLAKVISRAGAKFLWAIIAGMRFSPDLYMGYHIFPAAVSALIVARIFNRPACYQDTSGPLELEGGGWHAENKILTMLGRPSKAVERAVFAVALEFDLIVVRGALAKSYICEAGYKGELAVITGCVDYTAERRKKNERDIDLVFVGRLTECKRAGKFVEIVCRLKELGKNVRVVIIGDGPDRESLEKTAFKNKLNGRLEFLGQRKDVMEKLATSKIYVLTSRWESLSIAMIEAMSAGAVPVVPDIGDLRDLVQDSQNGYVISDGDVESYARIITNLLEDDELWNSMSIAAVKSAREYCGMEAISGRWREHFGELLKPAAGVDCS